MSNSASIEWHVIFLAVINALIAFGSLAMVYMSKKSIKTQEDQNRSLIMIECLRLYADIQRGRTKAVTEKNAQMAKDYYREMLDLHWTEYYLWKNKMIYDGVMKLWLDARHRNYKDDRLTIETAPGAVVNVAYSDVWAELRNIKYFAPNDPFVSFIEKVHDGTIEEAMKEGKKKP